MGTLRSPAWSTDKRACSYEARCLLLDGSPRMIWTMLDYKARWDERRRNRQGCFQPRDRHQLPEKEPPARSDISLRASLSDMVPYTALLAAFVSASQRQFVMLSPISVLTWSVMVVPFKIERLSHQVSPIWRSGAREIDTFEAPSERTYGRASRHSAESVAAATKSIAVGPTEQIGISQVCLCSRRHPVAR
jgi:hypothetical protein